MIESDRPLARGSRAAIAPPKVKVIAASSISHGSSRTKVNRTF